MTLTADLHISHSYTRTVRARRGDCGERVITAPASTRLRPNGSSGERHHVITVADGVGLACSDYGDPEARRTVVFLHGLCLSQQSWARHVAYVRHRYGGTVRVISYDHRGHGQSQPAPVSTYRPEQLADDLAYVTAELQIAGSTILVGHSLGAMVALAYLARQRHQRPVDPDGLVLVATAAGRLGERGLGRLLATPGIVGLSRLLEHAPQQARRALSAPVCAALSRCLGYGDTQRATLAAMTAAALMTTRASSAVGFLPALRDFNAYPTLGAIRARTVVISGTDDLVTPPVHGRELADQIPGAVHVCVPGAGHMLAQQAPHVIASAIDHVL
jgi:pimeloyl-ACP methyl ester carboxylesterase